LAAGALPKPPGRVCRLLIWFYRRRRQERKGEGIKGKGRREGKGEKKGKSTTPPCFEKKSTPVHLSFRV